MKHFLISFLLLFSVVSYSQVNLTCYTYENFSQSDCYGCGLKTGLFAGIIVTTEGVKIALHKPIKVTYKGSTVYFEDAFGNKYNSQLSRIRQDVRAFVSACLKDGGLQEVELPWAKVGDTISTSATPITIDDDIYREGFTVIGPNANIESQDNESVIIKTNNEDVALKLKTDTSSTEFKPLVFDYSNINSDNFPNFDFRASRFDGINGIDPLPNLVTRMGYNAGSGAPPLGQIKLETAYEYYYNLQNANPLVAPDIVSEWHIEFTPLASSGKPIQRWISWAGRHNGTKTDCTITSDVTNIVGSDNRQIIKIEDNAVLPTSFRFVRGGKILSNVGDVEFEQGIKISGAGNLYNSNGGDLNFGNSTNKNFSNFYGLTAAAGVIQRLKNDNLSSGFDFRINSVPSFTLTQASTGNDILTLFSGAPNFAMVIRANGNIGFGGLYSPVHPIQHNNGAHLTAAGAWTNASDRAYKTSIKKTKYGLVEILKLNPVDYTHITSGLEQTGFIAQEVEKIIPEFVTGEEGSKGVNYGQMVAVLAKAIQDQQKIIEALSAEVKKLSK